MRFAPDVGTGVSCLAVVATVCEGKHGRGAFFLCPFHDDHEPSLRVFDDASGGHFHCYGCGAHGDQFAFVMRTQGCSFMEARAWIHTTVRADAADELVDGSFGSKRKPQVSTDNQALASRSLSALQRYYTRHLQAVGGKGLEVHGGSLGRFIRDNLQEAVDVFQLGLAPCESVLGMDLDPKNNETGRKALLTLIDEGLIRADGTQFLGSRITVRIQRNGVTLALIGRSTLPHARKRWLAGKPSSIPWPSPLLYFPSTNDLRAAQRGIVVFVEGYGDAILLTHAGLYCVAAFGCAVPPRHLSDWLLEHNIKHVVHIPDHDKTGLAQIAAVADHAQKAGATFAAFLPDEGLDPADMFQSDTPVPVGLASLIDSGWPAEPLQGIYKYRDTLSWLGKKGARHV